MSREITNKELMGTFAQAELDKVTRRMDEHKEPMIEFHDIYCPCARCVIVRAERKKELGR